MISRKLTKIQKDEIVEAYRGGENTNTLAKKYNCSSNTINRTVKTLLTDLEYKVVKEARLKSSNKKVATYSNKSCASKKDDFEQQNTFKSTQEIVNQEEQSIENNHVSSDSEFNEIAFLPLDDILKFEGQQNEKSQIEKINNDPDNNLEEIVPLVSDFDFERKELNLKIHNQEILPEVVYMLVDKKVELEVKTISDLPEWSFLPDNELKRDAILLFSTQRTAKRSCSRNQRVIKIPNTNIFNLTKSYLLSKGITRLILEESIIALDD
tara:strand:- start:2174 stop:2974 length:801 start_codon:yes stop_codon:yes gene_type:complete